MNHEPPDVQAGFKKGRETRDPIANIRWIIDKARESRKKSTSPLSTNAKVFDIVNKAEVDVFLELLPFP